MKKITLSKSSIPMVLAIVFMGTICSCTDENGIDIDSNIALDGLSDEVELATSFEEVDDLTLAGASHDFSTGGRHERDGRFECAEISKEETGDGVIITIDFGEGCEGPNGRVRAGIIKITKIGDHLELGSVMSTELIGFTVDDLAMQGTRTITNVSDGIGSNPVFEVVLEGGEVTWPDGTSATREALKTRTLFIANDSLGNEIQVEGTSRGVNRAGESVEVLILEPLVFLRTCRGGKKFVPVSGVKQITKAAEVIVIDFGAGTCDNLATKTVDGVATEIEISPRRFKNK
jgi:hypothetical protein